MKFDTPAGTTPIDRLAVIGRSTLRCPAALAVILLACGSPAAAEIQKEAPMTEINRKADQKTNDGPAEFFTGKTTVTMLFQRDEPSRVPTSTTSSFRDWRASASRRASITTALLAKA